MRYDTICILNPVFIVPLTTNGTGTQYPLGVDASEIGFWFMRVASINITGTMSDPGTSYPSTSNNVDMTGKNLSGSNFTANTELQSWELGTRFSCSVEDPTESPTLVVNWDNSSYFNTGIDDSKNWFTNLQVSKLVAPGGSPMFTTNNTTSLPMTGVTVTFTATDSPSGKSYSHTLQTFGSATATGSFVITPKSFFPFTDVEGVALYDTSSGAFI